MQENGRSLERRSESCWINCEVTWHHAKVGPENFTYFNYYLMSKLLGKAQTHSKTVQPQEIKAKKTEWLFPNKS